MVQATVLKGLDRVDLLAPGRGFVEASAGFSTLTGAFAKVEAGWRVSPFGSVFAFGQATPVESSAGIGARFTF